MKKLFLPALALLMLLAGLLPLAAAQDDTQTPAELCAEAFPAPEPESRSFSQAEQVLEEGVDYYAIFCTSAGPVYIDLYEEQTPITVNNFVFLAEQGYYNNINFHRVIESFMAQGGDPTNTGTGGPGYQFEDEILPDLTFDRPGLLAMANAGPGTNGSQFFITTAVTDWLNGAHTIFGEVVSGYDNVLAVQLRDPAQSFYPGTRLDTVLIVTDPASVSTEEEVFTPATREDVEASFAALPELIPASLNKFIPDASDILALDDAQGGVFSTEEQVARVPEEAQEDIAAYYAQHGHEYTAAAFVANTDCDLEALPIAGMGYSLDTYPTVEDATAALNDPVVGEIQATLGFELAESAMDFPVYISNPISACGNDELYHARGIWQRGRFVVTVDFISTQDTLQFAGPLINEFAGVLFEEALWRVIRPEVRAE